LWQANWVKARLEERGYSVEILIIQTTGDRIQNVTLAEAGGTKALFVKEIEEALLDRRVDVAVHSLKDVPAELPAGLVIAAFPPREDVRDILMRRAGDADGGVNGRIGTSSLRRTALLRAQFPDVKVEMLRGNLDTRIRRLDEGVWDGIIVAAAGVHRLGMSARITRYFSTDEMCPAIGQGSLAIESRGDEALTAELTAALDHSPTRRSVTAERVVMRVIGGGCRLPVAAHATCDGEAMTMRAVVASPDGSRVVSASASGTDPETLGNDIARELRANGAEEILAAIA